MPAKALDTLYGTTCCSKVYKREIKVFKINISISDSGKISSYSRSGASIDTSTFNAPYDGCRHHTEYGLKITMCYCSTDLCNMAHNVRPGIAILMFSVIMVIVKIAGWF